MSARIVTQGAADRVRTATAAEPPKSFTLPAQPAAAPAPPPRPSAAAMLASLTADSIMAALLARELTAHLDEWKTAAGAERRAAHCLGQFPGLLAEFGDKAKFKAYMVAVLRGRAVDPSERVRDVGQERR